MQLPGKVGGKTACFITVLLLTEWIAAVSPESAKAAQIIAETQTATQSDESSTAKISELLDEKMTEKEEQAFTEEQVSTEEQALIEEQESAEEQASTAKQVSTEEQTASLESTKRKSARAPVLEITEEGGNLSSGSYQLEEDVMLFQDLVILENEEVTIDLNGCEIIGTGDDSVIKNYGILTIEDTSEKQTGSIAGGNATNGGGIYNDGILFFYGGFIYGNRAAENGGGIYNSDSGEVEMYGGCVGSTNITLLWSNGTRNKYPKVNEKGYIRKMQLGDEGCWANNGGGIANEGKFTMSGGKIVGNSSTNSGAGLYHFGKGSFFMSGGEIYGNHASVSGGGIYLADGESTMEITGGQIRCNRAEGNGGGVVSFGNAMMGNEADISYNVARLNGGAIAVENSGKVEMDGVSLCHNTAIGTSEALSGRGGGIWSTGTCSIFNSICSYNQASCGGGIYVGGGESNVSGGLLHHNQAVGTPEDSGEEAVTTAYDSEKNAGVGGGVYIHDGGILTLGKEDEKGNTEIGIYANQADFAADDVYCAPIGRTTIVLPSVEQMNLSDYSENQSGTLLQWYEDYVEGDTRYKDEKSLKGAQDALQILRYRAAKEQNTRSEVAFSITEPTTLTGRYVCLTLGSQPEEETEEGYELPEAGGRKIIFEITGICFLFLFFQSRIPGKRFYKRFSRIKKQRKNNVSKERKRK
jgi:hypothetical protein